MAHSAGPERVYIALISRWKDLASTRDAADPFFGTAEFTDRAQARLQAVRAGAVDG